MIAAGGLFGEGDLLTEIELSCYSGPWGASGFVEAITKISACGFDGVETPASVVQSFEDRLHVFEEILETSSLKFSGLVQQLNLLDHEHADFQVERAANAARFASAAGSACLTICHDTDHEGSLNDEQWATLGAVIEEIGERCGEFGIEVAFLPRMNRLVSNERDIKRLMSSTNPDIVKLAIDTGEIVLAGSLPQRILKSHFDRLRVVRYKDVNVTASGPVKKKGLKKSQPTLFGKGQVNFEAISKLLLTEGYTGWVVLDISADAENMVEAIEDGYSYIMRKSGLFLY